MAGMNPHEYWFISSISCKLGNFEIIDFWHNHWLDVIHLCRKYPGLFHYAHLGFSKICDLGAWINGCWTWIVRLQSNIWDQTVVVLLWDLVSFLHPIQPLTHVSDQFVLWKVLIGIEIHIGLYL